MYGVKGISGGQEGLKRRERFSNLIFIIIFRKDGGGRTFGHHFFQVVEMLDEVVAVFWEDVNGRPIGGFNALEV